MAKAFERFDPHNKEIREQTKVHHIKRYEFAATLNGLSYLDICCGQGYGTNILKQEHHNAFVLGVDKDIQTILNAKKEYPNCNFVSSYIEYLKLHNKFDVVVMLEAIEHFPYKIGLNIINKIYYEYLDNKGVYILSTPRDIQDRDNIYHKSVWSFATLKNELGSLFQRVDIFGQSWKTGAIEWENVVNNDFYIAVCYKGI